MAASEKENSKMNFKALWTELYLFKTVNTRDLKLLLKLCFRVNSKWFSAKNPFVRAILRLGGGGGAPLVTWCWGVTRHLFFPTLYNSKKWGGGGGARTPLSLPAPRSLWVIPNPSSDRYGLCDIFLWYKFSQLRNCYDFIRLILSDTASCTNLKRKYIFMNVLVMWGLFPCLKMSVIFKRRDGRI